MPESITGIVDRVNFHNTENGFCVLKVKAKGHRDPITVVGKLPHVVAGEFIEAEGDWFTDQNFGPQFKTQSMRTTPPHTPEGIIKYLSGGFVKGIGPTYAKKIVEHFGDKTLEVIDQSVGFLSQVPGIGPKRIALIRESWAESRAIRQIIVFLQSYGLGEKTAYRIYKTYGDTAIDQVRQNPYRLATDIWGIGFKTADALAIEIGIDRQSPLRARAAISYVLKEASSNGHVCLPEAALIEQTMALTDIPAEILTAAIDQLTIDGDVVRDRLKIGVGVSPASEEIQNTRGRDGHATDDHFIYLRNLFKAEVGVAGRLHELLKGKHPLPQINLEKAIAWAEKKMGIELAQLQNKAIAAACQQKILVVTGGPGTGKTTLIRAIIDIFAAKGLNIKLAAPTGRAAKRLSESTGREARTIHRLLEFDPGHGGFRYSIHEPLDADLFVIDESSMLDIRLAYDLLQAIPPYSCVIFVGDIDQLPSVGPGSVLGDLINSGIVPVVRLSVVHRQAAESWIVRAAHSINEGREPESAPPGGGDFYIVDAEEPATVIDRILQIVTERIPKRFGYDPVNDVQVLCPMNRNELGVQNLNDRLQQKLNPAGPPEVQRGGVTFRVGDKVLQTQNNYKREVFNGDIGRIVEIQSNDQILFVDFDGKVVVYDFKDLDELTLAYAITIHKSQGSEYPVVVIPVHTQNFIMLERNLIYTGVTRGRKFVCLVGTRKALWIAVNKVDTAKRFGRLVERLKSHEITA